MQLILLLLLGLASSQKLCFPPTCRSDANCVDPIHNVSAKCCGGACVIKNTSYPARMIGEDCDPCVRVCHESLVCSNVDRKCHPRKAAGCNCTSNMECLDLNCFVPNIAVSTQRVCRGYTNSIPVGGVCFDHDDCIFEFCNASSQCDIVPLGGDCDSSYPRRMCVSGASCKAGNSRCSPLCESNATGCCFVDQDCKNSTEYCDVRDGSCQLPPELGEVCLTKCQDPLICDWTCNETTCDQERVCQERSQVPVGGLCHTSDQCAQNASCGNNGTSTNICLRNIAVGLQCVRDSDCAPPASICSAKDGIFANICKIPGATQIDSRCDIDTPAECVVNSTCTRIVRSNPICTGFLPVGAKCTPASMACTKNSVCYPDTGKVCTFSVNCSCLAFNSVASGGACLTSLQCNWPDFACLNGTCVPTLGMPCDSMTECGGEKYDCGCDHKCYLATHVSEPTIPTCPVEQTAWQAVQPRSFNWPTATPGLIANPLAFQKGLAIGDAPMDPFVESIMALSPDLQAKAIAFACCMTCPINFPYSGQGYQVDCAKKTLEILPPPCDDDERDEVLPQVPAFVNCWTWTRPKPPPLVSSATHQSAVFGLGMALVFSLLRD